MGLSVEEFSSQHVRKIGKRYSLTERPTSYACTLLEGQRCSVYEARPQQCRSFPFWTEHLESPEGWAEAAKRCEGIDEEAPLIPQEEIDARRERP